MPDSTIYTADDDCDTEVCVEEGLGDDIMVTVKTDRDVEATALLSRKQARDMAYAIVERVGHKQ